MSQDHPITPNDPELSEQPVGGLQEVPLDMPVLPVRDIVIFTYMILPLFVGRDKSVAAVNEALNTHRYLLVLSQRDEQVDEPGPEDLYTVGTVCQIMRMLKMPDGRLKVLVQGVTRAKVESFQEHEGHLSAGISLLEEPDIKELSLEHVALMRAAREQSEKILSLRGIAPGDIMGVLNSVNEPGRLADLVASNLRMKVEEAQQILEARDPIDRLHLVNTQLARELELAAMQAKIQTSAREGMDKAQKDYYLREQLKAIRKELGEMEGDNEELEELALALEKAGLPKEVKAESDKQLKRLSTMHSESSEASVIRTYLEWLVELPWKKQSRDRLDIKEAKRILNEDHFGLDKVKDRILEYLSVRKLNPKMKGPILCFVGPPGVGKTSLGRSIARSLGRQFHRMSLGGMRDEAEIRGHRRTYIGAMPGRIIQAIKQAKTKNPVIMLDEIDKVGTDFRGDPSSALLEVLDPEQNFSFQDHYLNVPFDLSKVMFICTANQLDTIPSALMDRMEVIRIPGYTMQEKLKIARKYLIPRQARENGLTSKEVEFSDAVLQQVIKDYTREAGLRNLEREVGAVFRKLARKKAEGESGPFKVTSQGLRKLLGVPRFTDEKAEKDLPPGVSLGLAWTPYGGEILHIEATTMAGKGKLILTGQLGDVMKESAQAALSYARGHAGELGIDPEFPDKVDIHIHVPAGATPKDGPSAGIALVSALVSALSNRPLNGDMAMTGEITLRGRVLPVGGIKEKILAAVAQGLGHVAIPKENMKDLEDIPTELRRKITVHPLERIGDVWSLTLAEAPVAAQAAGEPAAPAEASA
ncbi:endopeptidase La [Megalodesulfovibrio paquesii]